MTASPEAQAQLDKLDTLKSGLDGFVADKVKVAVAEALAAQKAESDATLADTIAAFETKIAALESSVSPPAAESETSSEDVDKPGLADDGAEGLHAEVEQSGGPLAFKPTLDAAGNPIV